MSLASKMIQHPNFFRYRMIFGISGLVFLCIIILRCDYIRDTQHINIKKVLFINPSANIVSSKEEKNDLNSSKYSLFIAGIRYSECYTDHLDSVKTGEFDILVLPYAAASNLTEAGTTIIKNAVSEGTCILLDGVTGMSNALNIKLKSNSIYVSQLQDAFFPKDTLFWSDSVLVTPVDTVLTKCNTICFEEYTRQSVAVTGKFGKGKFIFYSTLFDPVTDKGYSRFPLMIEYLDRVFGLKALAQRRKVEMYFDPGMRDNSISIENLAKSWRHHNIKVIYAAGWYFDYGYDYETLINSCHANGILVYCWLETPMISKKFWETHPEWREKTATLRDAYVDWRYLMNLANDDCRKAVLNAIHSMLISYDWDGVDLAELYFEPSPVGPELPENFTPMNDLVRNDFRNLSGFDPILIFDEKSNHYWKTNNADWKMFANYRKDLCYKLKIDFLDFLTAVKKEKNDFEIMLTVIDVSLTPELSDNIGEDTKHALSLYSMYDISMQIEDPSNCWGLTPERYKKLGESYRKTIDKKDKLIFDCNVVNAHEKGYGGFPAQKPTGEEIRQIVYNMSLSDCRPAFYAEDAMNENDFQNISAVLARDTKIAALTNERWEIIAPATVLVNIGGKNEQIKLDNKSWFAREDNYAIIPSGRHILEFTGQPLESGGYSLKFISGELKQANFLRDTLELSYTENINSCYIILDKHPRSIDIDAKKTDCAIYMNNSSEYSVKLPEGDHSIRIIF
jgi:hypothetical protein